MTIINLYKTGNAVGPNPAYEGQEVHGYRLVADDGKILTDGETYAGVIDVSPADKSKWTEVDDDQADDGEELSYEDIGKILVGDE